MAQSWLFRILAALVAFAVVAIAAIALAGNFTSIDAAVNTFPLVTAVALAGAAAAYAAVEYGQTGRLDSLASEFDTRTLVLMPLAIATNIVLGAAVANALKIPIYLDSIGTILVGVLAGPIAGAATGFLSNVLWQYVVPPPLQGSVAAAFSLTAAVIGLLAGVAGRLGVMRPRPARPTPQLLAAGAIAVAVVGGLGWFAYSRFYEETFDPLNAEAQGTLLAVLGWLAAAVILAAVAGLFALLLIRRDLTVAYVVVAGAVTGVIAALISAPVAAGLFGGVTGAGTDFLVAFFRQQGADPLAASFQQSLISDPVDKVTTFFVVYLVLQASSRRVLVRFPQGARVVAPEPA